MTPKATQRFHTPAQIAPHLNGIHIYMNKAAQITGETPQTSKGLVKPGRGMWQTGMTLRNGHEMDTAQRETGRQMPPRFPVDQM